MKDKKSNHVSLAVRWDYAQAMRQSGDEAGAARELTALLERDPERPEAWRVLAELYAARWEDKSQACLDAARVLSGSNPQPLAAEGPGSQLGRVLLAQAAWRAGHVDQAESICRSAVETWPMCVQFHLILAVCLASRGEHELAVDHVRLVRTFDPDGEVWRRWEAQGKADEEASEQRSQVAEAARKTIDDVARSLEPAARRKKPFHAIISARLALARICGSHSLAVEQAMIELAALVARCEDIAAETLWIDDAGALAPFGLRPVTCDAASICQLLDGLDDALDTRGLQLASVLIVGGDEIIPFHRLPNPTDDQDADVPTDAPYGCRAERDVHSIEALAFPDRLVGRMPHSALTEKPDNAADMLLQQLRAACRARIESPRARDLGSLLRWLIGRRAGAAPLRSFGYAASVWRLAAQEVFNVIGPAGDMRLSPPMAEAEVDDVLAQLAPQLAYFNLHGLVDSPHWYGQRAPELGDYPPFPVALSPTNINRPARAVFTAACYGAHVAKRDASTCIALRFMQAGTWAFVGSTTVAYGGLDKPLVGADLLGSLFWKYIVEGYSSGEALRQAKTGFARQMQDRQGYLDGEDMKTLASFVLLGDPLVAPAARPQSDVHLKASLSKTRAQFEASAPSPLLCTHGARRRARAQLPEEYLLKIKQHVIHALPEMSGAALRVSLPAIPWPASCVQCDGECSDKIAKSAGFSVQVSLSASLPYGDYCGVQVVRVTLDSAGKIAKMAVSK